MAGKLEVTLKINSLPHATMNKNGARFGINADGRVVSFTLKPKVWKKITDAAAQWPLWVASVTGKMGPNTPEGFELLEPAVQVFEKKAKEAQTAPKEGEEKAAPVEEKPEQVPVASDTKTVTITIKPRSKLAP